MGEADVRDLAIDRRQGRADLHGRSRKGIAAALVAVAAAVVVAIAWYTAAGKVDVEVASVARLRPSALLAGLNASGYVAAQLKADVASKITGRVAQVFVQEGSVVEKGGLLAMLEDDEARAAYEEALAHVALARARLEQAKAELEDAARDFERKRSLAASGALSIAELDAARTRLDSSRASVDACRADLNAGEAAARNAKAVLSSTEIRAPFAGVVLTKNADVGDIVTPLGAAANAKAAVVSLADLSSLQVEVDVSETNLSRVKVNQPCDIELDALPGEHFAGAVDAVVPTVDRSKATVTVKVRFERIDSRILPEMSARVSFLERNPSEEENTERTMVDRRALVARQKKVCVFVVADGRARLRPVRVGRRYGDMVVVLEGLAPGDTVVLNPGGMRDGARVRIAGQ